jgi:DNA-binding MltR family transcriptional regulator
MNTPILRCSDSYLPYEFQTDASETGIGAVLQQTDENCTRPVTYMSRKLNAAEQNYTFHEREILAVVGALHEWRAYLSGNKFIVKSDHRPLQYLQTQTHLSLRQALWVSFFRIFILTGIMCL